MTRALPILVLAAAAAICEAPRIAAASMDVPPPEILVTPAEDGASRETEAYDRGTKALDDENWTAAAAAFQEVVRLGGSRSDGATYWLAYSLAKQGRRDDALTLLRGFESKYPKSTWRKDVRALELEIRPASGRAVLGETGSDDDLKLMAINGLMSSDPEQAVPLLEKVLAGGASDRVKERALFVLAQSSSPRARQILGEIARGKSRPELQEKAIQYLGITGGKAGAQVLSDVYASSPSREVRRKVLHAWMVSGEKNRVLEAARNETDAELRVDAVHQLGVMGARTELWELYKNDSAESVRQAALQAMFIAGDVEHVLELARTEASPTLRRAAIHNLGLMGGGRAGAALVSIYREEKDRELKSAAVQGLFLQDNGKALVEIARGERDPQMKSEIVSKLSLMRNKDATDYMLEILNK